MTLKRELLMILSGFIGFSYLYALPAQDIAADEKGNAVQISFNDGGIIESITGEVGDLPFNPIKIDFSDESIRIELRFSSDGCFNIRLDRGRNFIKVTKIFINNEHFKHRENLSYTVFYGTGDEYYLKDDFIEIRKDGCADIFKDPADSYLPHIRFEDDVLYHYYGSSMDGPGTFRYEYSKDKRTVVCSQIMPGDAWENFLTLKICDIKSENTAINAINYFILRCYNSNLGAIFFPVLFDLGGKTEG